MTWLSGTLHQLLCTPLSQYHYFHSQDGCFINKNHFGGFIDHCFVKSSLFRNGCNVGVVDESKDWLKETGLSTIGIPN